MALRARLVAPPPASPPAWRWHRVKKGEVSATLLAEQGRRLEAEAYLSSGFGLRRAIERQPSGWNDLGTLAEVWMPGRLKGIQVSSDVGTPFLAATQLFDPRPIPRKWLALARTADASRRFVKEGMILVTCSGTVGRTTVAVRAHEKLLVSHDLLRVEARDMGVRGWLYAFLLSSHARSMATTEQYGHIIQHIEASHLVAIPVPDVDAATKNKMNGLIDQVIDLRNSAASRTLAAEKAFSDAVRPTVQTSAEVGFRVSSRTMLEGRRRFEAAYHAPSATAIIESFDKSENLDDVTKKVYWMSRFKRIYGDGGLPYLSADELFTTNPQMSKRILVAPNDGHEKYFVERDWIVMACSGQIYGLNGAAMLMTPHHEKTFFSHDLIRIIPDSKKIRAGYLLTALTHPTLGRPVLIREAYGTSIPHLDPGDVARFPVVRLDAAVENRIADLAEDAAQARAEAGKIERGMAAEADEIIEQFIS